MHTQHNTYMTQPQCSVCWSVCGCVCVAVRAGVCVCVCVGWCVLRSRLECVCVCVCVCGWCVLRSGLECVCVCVGGVCCFPGPAQVPMMSPNGSVPPIYVPPGYVSQVLPLSPLMNVVTHPFSICSFL